MVDAPYCLSSWDAWHCISFVLLEKYNKRGIKSSLSPLSVIIWQKMPYKINRTTITNIAPSLLHRADKLLVDRFEFFVLFFHNGGISLFDRVFECSDPFDEVFE